MRNSANSIKREIKVRGRVLRIVTSLNYFGVEGRMWDVIVLIPDHCLSVYEGISKSFEPNMERARNLDLFCFIFQRSPLPTPHTCPI